MSKSIFDSKKNSVFIHEFYVKKRLDNIIVYEAWIEKVWHYKQEGHSVKRVINDSLCNLCFRMKQLPNMPFMIANYTHWSMEDVVSKNRVGVKVFEPGNIPDGVYKLELSKSRCSKSDTIRLDLIQIEFGELNNKRSKVGNIHFIPKS